MADPADNIDPMAASTPRGRARVPGRGRVAGAVALVAVGSFMPWIDTALGNVSGARGAGLWTFYAAMLGLAGVLAPKLILLVVQAAVLAAAAVVLPLWQVVHLVSLVGMEGWRPGPGLVLVLGGGVLAAVGAWEAWQHGRSAATS